MNITKLETMRTLRFLKKVISNAIKDISNESELKIKPHSIIWNNTHTIEFKINNKNTHISGIVRTNMNKFNDYDF